MFKRSTQTHTHSCFSCPKIPTPAVCVCDPRSASKPDPFLMRINLPNNRRWFWGVLVISYTRNPALFHYTTRVSTHQLHRQNTSSKKVGMCGIRNANSRPLEPVEHTSGLGEFLSSAFRMLALHNRWLLPPWSKVSHVETLPQQAVCSLR